MLLPTLLVFSAACSPPKVEVDHPFYLTYFETPDQMALFRCPNGRSGGCAIDGLPGATVLAAGASKQFITVKNTEGYFYFARVAEETGGCGNSPEKIIGPLTEHQFNAAKARFDLPDLLVQP